ncbi:DUF3772 domain-containing protein [uncultured Sphingomonas sp.]|uniref:DUF3772 domain-containing protein n=1 Tax=uncultured Sphingomonas sp. TaxID=158754 RepID=UPI0035CBB582
MTLFYATGACAQDTSLADLSRELAQAETDVGSVDRALDGKVDAAQTKLLRAKATAAGGSAADAAGQLQQQAALVEARAAQLGPVTPGVAETPDIKAQRANIAGQRVAIGSAVKRARLVEVEAQQMVDEIDRSQAEQLGQKLSTHYISPVAPVFWANVLAAAPRDLRRMTAFFAEASDAWRVQWQRSFPWTALAGALLALVLLFPARLLARRAGQRFLVDGTPGNRVRRSGYALWRVMVGTVAPLLAAVSVVQGADWSGLVPASWRDLLDTMVTAAGFAGYVVALAGAVLLRSQPSWRVVPIDDDAAKRLRPIGWLLAAVAASGRTWGAFNQAVGASTPALVATQAIEALLHLVLIAGSLVILGRLRSARVAGDDPAAEHVGAGVGLFALVGWIVVVTALVSLVTGYIGFSLFLGQVFIWAAILAVSVYLLSTAVDDLATSVFARGSRTAGVLTGALGIRASAIDQFGVLLSGVTRVALIVLALGLLLSPFGAGDSIMSIFGRLGVLSQGLEVGGIAISPGAVLRGVVVLLIGLGLLRVFMSWLDRRYLPITDLDGSGRNSVSLVARYVGTAIAFIWALASLGIGVERIALLLSALSVGIGFGLQAITQNFISGLILLAERPIKIGDLIRVGNDEGDVRRISVRSTEIELADHSTLIVPNSELITKSVLNKTLAGPLGRIQVQFSVPIQADVEQARLLTLAAFAAVPDVLTEPAPVAFVDSIVDGRVLFNCFGHVASPRTAYPTRSLVLLTLMRDLRRAGIEMGSVPRRLELIPPPTPLREGG